jgi:hypothetical protein
MKHYSNLKVMKMTILKTMAATFCKTDREHDDAQQQRQENRKNSKTKEEKNAMKEVETYLQHRNDEHLDSATMLDLKDDASK